MAGPYPFRPETQLGDLGTPDARAFEILIACRQGAEAAELSSDWPAGSKLQFMSAALNLPRTYDSMLTTCATWCDLILPNGEHVEPDLSADPYGWFFDRLRIVDRDVPGNFRDVTLLNPFRSLADAPDWGTPT